MILDAQEFDMRNLNYPTKEQIEAVIYSAVTDVENGMYDNKSHVTLKFHHGDNNKLTCSMTVLKERLTNNNVTKKLLKDICSTFSKNKKTSKKEISLPTDARVISNKYTKVLVWLDNNEDNEFVRSAAMFLFNYDDRDYVKRIKDIERSNSLTTSDKVFKLYVLKKELSDYKAERFRCNAVVNDFYSKMIDV